MSKNVDLKNYFLKPVQKKQKQYEAVRAFAVEAVSAKEVADKFGYKLSSVYTFIKNVKSGEIDFFPEQKKGPRQRRVPIDAQQKIVRYRNQSLSYIDITIKLNNEGVIISA